MPPRLIRVLVLEDDPLLRRSLERWLGTEGFVVTAAPDGASAHRAAESASFDVGIFDIDLPDSNGVSVAAALLEAGRVDRAVFFTAATSERDLATAFKHGVVVNKRDGAGPLMSVLAEMVNEIRSSSDGPISSS
jgi:DNA-binding response OmpR family regulator